ncbi:MAG: cobalamin biosynthesis protein CobG [Sphingomonadaceae bacterium]|nr:cobalamin biosynthesis protein CobG [Sphingomonadaceae bacterium]
MNLFVIKGWCPDAWRPMAAGDGLLVRVRPALGRLKRADMRVLGEVAAAHGSGQIDLTSRANLQLRGVRDDSLPALLGALMAQGLVDADPQIEARRSLIVPPDWREGDDSARIARDLAARLSQLPDLPGKTGFVIDAGVHCALLDESGDFRIERGSHGGLILRAAGHRSGAAIEHGQEADALVQLACWFAQTGGREARRMARHRAPLPPFATGLIAPAIAAMTLRPGPHPLGTIHGAPFGRIDAQLLTRLADNASVVALRVTPWRLLLIEGQGSAATDGLIHDPADPLLRVDACPGHPACPHATVDTRDLARRLAPHVEGRLHISGCAKGCARAAPAHVVLTGRDGRFDLAINACAGAQPLRAGLGPADILAHFGAD